MLLDGVGRPGVQHLVQELAAVPSDVPTLGRDVRRQDRDEASGVGVPDDEPDADDSRGGHDFGGVLDEIDDVLEEVLEQAIRAVAELLGQIRYRDASFTDNLNEEKDN